MSTFRCPCSRGTFHFLSWARKLHLTATMIHFILMVNKQARCSLFVRRYCYCFVDQVVDNGRRVHAIWVCARVFSTFSISCAGSNKAGHILQLPHRGAAHGGFCCTNTLVFCAVICVTTPRMFYVCCVLCCLCVVCAFCPAVDNALSFGCTVIGIRAVDDTRQWLFATSIAGYGIGDHS